MGLNYTAIEGGGFSTTYFTALTVVTDGTTSTTDNFTFAKVTGTTTDLVIIKTGYASSVTVDTDAAAAVDVTAYEYTVQGSTYLAIFYVKNNELHFSVYNDDLEVVEADNVLTSTYTTVDGVHGIYSHNDNGAFIVDASSTSGSSANFNLSYQITNDAPEFLSGLVGEADSNRPAAFTAAEIGEDNEGDTLSFSSIAVTSANAIYVTDDDGKVYVYYTGPTLAEGATASVTLDLTLSDGSDTTDGSYSITFEGTGSSTLDLSLVELGMLINAGYDTLASFGGEITDITLVDTLSALTSVTAEMLEHLTAAGVTVIDITTSEGSFTKDQLDVFLDAGVTFASEDAITLADTGSVLSALTETDIDSLAALGVDAVDATDDAWQLDTATLDAFIENNISFADDDAITLADTGAVLGALTDTEIDSLAALGVVAIDATDDVLQLDKATLDAYTDNGIALASDDVVTLADTASVISALTETEIQALAALGVDAVNATDDALELDRATFDAFVDNGIALASADTVTLLDTASALSALTDTEIATLATLGVDVVDATDDVLELDKATVDAFADSGIIFASGDDVTLADTGALFAALTETEIEALATARIDTVDATDNVWEIDKATLDFFSQQGLAIADDDAITIVDAAASLSGLTATEIASLATTGVVSVEFTDVTVDLDRATFNAYEDNDISFIGDSVLRILTDGTAKKDVLDGTEYIDIMSGQAKNDTLSGLAGNDELNGNEGDDILVGGIGDDDLKGNKGVDTLKGGAGADILTGGEGDDVMAGGAGADTFSFWRTDGHDVITDFADDDMIDLSRIEKFERFADVKAAFEKDGDDLILSVNASLEITLKDVSLKDLDRDNFIL